ncbi:hypothetical protein [Fulvivirga sediminis]|uniref:Uncharacterized protein n=1 Tax=Fulvivirga sediminis TaxID=2803949 RepID=A0A937K3G3_9BACT|nr:hypothetical protein [Fulvivirga sediminis]MBL3658947.1 hypothetical protein [Fulvivirga sediminis]
MKPFKNHPSRLPNKVLVTLFTLVLSVSIFSCGSDDDPDDPHILKPEDKIDLKEAFLTDFPIKEVDYVDIDLKQPTLVNGVQTNAGEITLLLPYTYKSDELTLESVNIDLEKFNVFPSVGAVMKFSEIDYVSYEIASRKDGNVKITYHVKIAYEQKPAPEQLFIRSFDFSADENTVAASKLKTIKSPKYTEDSLLFVVFPAAVDFSDLTPSLQYSGTQIKYKVGNSDYIDYTANNSIDFNTPIMYTLKLKMPHLLNL